MTKNEIKKKLYRQKPKAYIKGTRDGKFWYRAGLECSSELCFLIPKDEAENFDDIVDAQLLIRWLHSGKMYIKF